MDHDVLSKFNCKWMIKENTHPPAVRLATDMTLLGNKIYMFGGYNKNALNELFIIDPKTAKWKQIQPKNKKPEHRYGHTICTYKGALIIVGGEQKYNEDIRQREAFADVWQYNPNRNEYT